MADRTKRTGTVEPVTNVRGEIQRWPTGHPKYSGRVRLKDGSRKRINVPEGRSYPEARAEQYIGFRQELEDEKGELFAAKQGRGAKLAAASGETSGEGETCDDWYRRFQKSRKELGKWTKWISPHIGVKPIVSVTRNDIEDIRDALDVAIVAWTKAGGKNNGKKGCAISGKSAMNNWSCLTSAFKAATSGKLRDLRVLDGKPNPCVGVQPPGDRESRKSRRKTFLWPKEAEALLACEAIALEWRELYAIALYTYLRPGELRVLTWADVDLDALSISITKAWDYKARKVREPWDDESTDTDRLKKPKTAAGVRTVPIESALTALLTRMKKDANDPSGLVVPCLAAFGSDGEDDDGGDGGHLAEQWPKHCKLAGLKRDALHETTLTHVKSNFRSCRDSGITWLAMSGLGVDKVMRRAGHDTYDTTMGYVKLAEDISGNLGVPLGTLPPSLSGGRNRTLDPTAEPTVAPSTSGTDVGQPAVSTRNRSAGGGSRNRPAVNDPRRLKARASPRKLGRTRSPSRRPQSTVQASSRREYRYPSTPTMRCALPRRQRSTPAT